MILKMKCCNARDAIIIDRDREGETDYAYIYRRKKVYERTGSKVISIGSLDIWEVSGSPV